jgi:hypothetical protein
MTKFLAVAAAAAVLAGLLLGLIPGSFGTSYSGNQTCGSPWVRDHSGERYAAYVDDLATAMRGGGLAAGSTYRDECDDILDGRGIAGIVLASLGALALIGVGIAAGQNKQQPASAAPTAPAEDVVEEKSPTP